AHRRAQALKLLEEGLAVVPAYPGRRYLATYFNYANQGEEYARIFAAVDQCLANLREIEPKERNWLLQQKINALLAEKQAEAALVILDQQAPDVIFNEQRVLVLLALGRVPDAGKFLATWRQQDGATAQILRLQVRAFREAGQLKEMDEALEALRLLTPTDPTPYAYALIQRVMAGQATAAAAALDDYFLRFGALVKSVQLLAQPLAEIGAVDLLEQFIKKMAEQGHDRRSALLLLAQAHLKHGQWSAAEQVIAQVKALDAAVGGNASAGLDLMATLVAVTSNPAEGPQVQLLAYLNRQIYPLRSFRTIIDALLLAKRDEVALEVINCAERSYAGNVALAAYKVQAKDALAVQAKAAVGAPVAVKDTILSESAFFSRLDSAMAEKQWAAAADALRDVQLAKPSWLAARQTDVLVRQMRVAEARHEPLDLILAAKLLLAGATAQAQLVVDYAVELHGQNENENAVLLLREVLHKIPNHGLARRWLEEWQKRPEAVLTPPVTTPVPATAAPAVAQPATS
ncbi:MAG: hypothetical protein KBF26_12760, partial [Opitutaceae bacterium]|nr:hypothetical protein [Opitutaceae bacterium]